MKLNKKLMLLLLPLMVVTACDGGSNPDKPKNEKIVTINGYENINDMYRSKLVYPFTSYNIQCHFDINKDTNYIKEGTGSLKMYMERVSGGDYSYFVQRFSESNIAYRDIFDIDKFSLWLYNSTDSETKVTLALIGKGDSAVTTKEFNLTANSWNYLEYNLSRLILESSYEDLIGFGILINEVPGTYYLDEWKVYFGATYTEEDNLVLTDINSCSDKVAKLNKNMDFSNAEENIALEEACKEYYQINSAYRGAVKGNEDLLALASSYTDYLTLTSGGLTAFNFANPAGVNQASVSLLSTGGVELSYSTDFKRPDTNGSIKISANGNTKWTYLNFETSAAVAGYSKFGFWFYNDSDLEFGYCVQWNENVAHYIKPSKTIKSNDGWQYNEYSCAGLSGTVEFEYCAVGENIPGGVLDTKGDLYISDVVLVK